MRLAVDPALSLADACKVAQEIEKHARGHLPALERLLVETVPASDGERPERHPQAKHQHHH